MLPFRKKNREAYENFLRAKYEAYTHASTVTSYPYYLTIDPSDSCQLHCPTCPTGKENAARKTGQLQNIRRAKRGTMKPELFDALIDELGPYLFLVMLYNWGEPLLNKSLPPLHQEGARIRYRDRGPLQPVFKTGARPDR